MKPRIASRVAQLPGYPLAHIPRRKRELLAAGVDLIDLGAGQVLPSPIDRVRFSSRQSDCSIYGGWSHQLQA